MMVLAGSEGFWKYVGMPPPPPKPPVGMAWLALVWKFDAAVEEVGAVVEAGSRARRRVERDRAEVAVADVRSLC